MCFMNCPYENYDGECTAGKNIPPDGFCRENEFEDLDIDEDETY